MRRYFLHPQFFLGNLQIGNEWLMQCIILRKRCAEGKGIFPPLIIYFGIFGAMEGEGLYVLR